MAGSSVWYHLLSGTKVFLLALPTPANLAAYEAWAGSECQVRPQPQGCKVTLNREP